MFGCCLVKIFRVGLVLAFSQKLCSKKIVCGFLIYYNYGLLNNRIKMIVKDNKICFT
jgi:hypothetical protein